MKRLLADKSSATNPVLNKKKVEGLRLKAEG